MQDPIAREFLLTFWKIHVLHHADEGGLYGQWMLEELRRHGYALSPGTLYPLLARMEARGWLRRVESGVAKSRRVYRLTASGRQVLARLRTALDELYREVAETAKETPRTSSAGRRSPRPK